MKISIFLVLLSLFYPPIFQGELVDGLYLTDSDGSIKLKLNSKYQEFSFSRNPVIAFDNLKQAEVIKTQYGIPAILLEFNESGRKKLQEITTKNKGKSLGLIVDGKLQAAPKITEALSTNKLTIMGSLSEKEFSDIAERINKSIHK